VTAPKLTALTATICLVASPWAPGLLLLGIVLWVLTGVAGLAREA